MLKFKKNIDDRKELAQMLAGLTGQRSVYTRAPLYAYQVGAYMVDREGDLTVPEAEADWEVLNLLIEEGYILPLDDAAAEPEAEGIIEAEDSAEAIPVVEGNTTTEEVPATEEVATTAEADAGFDNLGEPPVEIEAAVTEEAVTEDETQADDAPVVTEAEYEQEIEEEALAQMDEDTDDSDTDITDDVPAETPPADSEVPADTDEDTVEFNFTLPIAKHTGTSLRNLVYLIYSRAPMLNKATGANFRVDKALVDFLRDETCTYTVDAFRKKLADYEAEHGSGMEGLVIGEDTVTFRGFAGDADHDHMTAYGHLTTMMNKMAITQKRIQAKSVNTENEKYGFRIWLLRLGMNGDEFKRTRKLLMEKLEGHTAFRTPEEAERAKIKAQQKRAELKAAKEAAEVQNDAPIMTEEQWREEAIADAAYIDAVNRSFEEA